MDSSGPPDRNPPIADYALIGDCHGSALVSKAGSIDWCCLRRFDGDPVMFRILDARRGGFWDVVFDEPCNASRRYVPGTNILETIFETRSRRVCVTDFMPVGRTRSASVHDYVSLNAPGWLVRRFHGIEGRVGFRTRFAPRGQNFSTDRLALRCEGDGIRCPDG